jgi:hypothetical protein
VARSEAAGSPVSSVEGTSDLSLATVRKASETWISRLIDLSRRNNLLYFRDLRTGTLDLTAASPDAVDDLFGGSPVPIERMLPSVDGLRVAALMKAILERALINREERGLETLFLARGMATWRPSDGGRPPEAPVVLLPLAVQFGGLGNPKFVFSRAGDLQVNPALCHALKQEFRIVLDPNALLAAGDDDDLRASML